MNPLLPLAPLCPNGETPPPHTLLSPDGRQQVMLVNFDRASDWPQIAQLYQAVQSDLDLPAPAISISGDRGYGLWFSLAEALPVEPARAFLDALRRHYLADIPEHQLTFHPSLDAAPANAAPAITPPPARHPSTGKWSAYIDPSLGSMFSDEPWLEMAPGMDQQTAILTRIDPIQRADFERALAKLGGLEKQAVPSGLPSSERDNPAPASSSHPTGHYEDPRSFLLAVMNDPSASTRQRIKAAKALLPYFS